MPDGNFAQLGVSTDFAALNQRKINSGKPNLSVQTVDANVQTAPAGSENKPYAVFVGGKQVGTYSTAAEAEAQRNKYPNQDFQVTTITGLQIPSAGSGPDEYTVFGDNGNQLIVTQNREEAIKVQKDNPGSQLKYLSKSLENLSGGTEDKVYKNITFTRRNADGQYETITESILRKDFPTFKAAIEKKYGDQATLPRMISDTVARKKVTAVDPLSGTQTIFSSQAAYDEVKNQFGAQDPNIKNSFLLNDSEKAGTYAQQELDQLRREVQKADEKGGENPYVTRHTSILTENIGGGTLDENGALGLPTLPLYKTDDDYSVAPQDLNLLKTQIVNGGVFTENLNMTTINALMNKFPKNIDLRAKLDSERLSQLGPDFAYVADGQFFRAKIEEDALSLPSMINKKYLDQLGAVTGISAPLISALTSLEGLFQVNQSNPEASALLQGIAFGNALSNVKAREIFGLEGQKLSNAILQLGETLNITTGAFTGLGQIKAQADVVIGILDNQISQSEKTADRAYRGLTSSQKGVEARNSMVAMIPYRRTLLEIKAAAENLNAEDFKDVLSQARTLQKSREITFGPGFDALGTN
jgi:hypothetical protein